MQLVTGSIHLVSTRETKTVRVNIKTKPSLRLEFRAVSIIEDDSMSNLINHYMRQRVKELKASDPVKFEEALEIAREETSKEGVKAKRLPKHKKGEPITVYLANNADMSGAIARQTGVSPQDTIEILSGMIEDKEPEDVRAVQEAAKKIEAGNKDSIPSIRSVNSR